MSIDNILLTNKNTRRDMFSFLDYSCVFQDKTVLLQNCLSKIAPLKLLNVEVAMHPFHGSEGHTYGSYLLFT